MTVKRITKSFISAGLYDNPPKDNFNANVTSEDHQDFSRKGVEDSTILLKNEDETLPLNKDGSNWLLVIGNAAANPVVAGGGSGTVHSSAYPPLWALCDELGIPKQSMPLDAQVSHGCNKDNSNCIAYYGINTLKKHHYTVFYNESEESEWVLDKETQINLQSIQQMRYDATLIFAGVKSGEGADR